MSLLKTLKLSLLPFAVAMLFALQSFAISKEMLAIVKFETKSNAVTTRSADMIRIEHYEIPMRIVSADVAPRMNAKLRESLMFMKNGEMYLRWIINPEDTKWHKEVEAHLAANGVSTQRHRHFEGYQTASRSYILVDPKNGAEFSAKVSTDKTGGNWTDKKQTYEDAWQIRMATDYVSDAVIKTGGLKNIILLDEPATFGLKEIDQGMVIRDYGQIAGTGFTYIPGFSVMHDETGRAIAQRNGAYNPAAFWNQHYNKPLARAIAEFAALTGMSYDSPHSQNFMVELDSRQRPTGRIVMRDYGDTYMSTEFFEAVGHPEIPKQWEAENVQNSWLKIAVGILHGNKAPSWIRIDKNNSKATSYDQWGRDFFTEFKKEFWNQTGVNPSGMAKGKRSGEYVGSHLPMMDDKGTKFLELARTGNQRVHLFRNDRCFALFAN